MKVKIKQVLEVSDRMSKANKPYKLTTFMGEDGKLYKDVYGDLKEGSEIEGEWKTDNFGTKFEIAKSGFGGKSDPERQTSIERQNSLSNAVSYCVAKANLMDKKDALKYLSGKEIIQVATYFKRYNEGKVTCVMEPLEIAEVFGYVVPAPTTEAQQTTFSAREDNSENMKDEVDIEELPDWEEK